MSAPTPRTAGCSGTRREQRGGWPWRPRPHPPLCRVPSPREAGSGRSHQGRRGGGGERTRSPRLCPFLGSRGARSSAEEGRGGRDRALRSVASRRPGRRRTAGPAKSSAEGEAHPRPCLESRGARTRLPRPHLCPVVWGGGERRAPPEGPWRRRRAAAPATPSPRRPAASSSAGGGAEEELRGHEPRASAPPPTEAGTGRPPPLALERRGQGGAQQRPPRRDPAVQEGVGEAAPSWSDTEEEERSRASAPSPAEAERGRPCRERRASRVAEARGRGRAGGRLVSSGGSPRNCGERGQRRIEDRRRGGGGGRGSGVLD